MLRGILGGMEPVSCARPDCGHPYDLHPEGATCLVCERCRGFLWVPPVSPPPGRARPSGVDAAPIVCA